MEALKDEDAEVREQAAWALGMIGDRSALNALTEAMNDEDPGVRKNAMWALSRVFDD